MKTLNFCPTPIQFETFRGCVVTYVFLKQYKRTNCRFNSFIEDIPKWQRSQVRPLPNFISEVLTEIGKGPTFKRNLKFEVLPIFRPFLFKDIPGNLWTSKLKQFSCPRLFDSASPASDKKNVLSLCWCFYWDAFHLMDFCVSLFMFISFINLSKSKLFNFNFFISRGEFYGA